MEAFLFPTVVFLNQNKQKVGLVNTSGSTITKEL